eukprot:snap_masked-scaffold_1-processed-gene-13.26-mRNA-1 protein AED:0.58 eAED:0.58 QI:0/0/0/0.5/1/1/2/0/519
MHIFGSIVVYLIEKDSKFECKGRYGFFAGYNYITGEALIIDKDERNLIKTRNFKITKRRKADTEQERLDKNIDTENISPYCPEDGVSKGKRITETKENDKNVEEDKNQKEKEIVTETILLPEQYMRRSSRNVQPTKRLTYAQAVSNDTKYIFEDVTFLFMQPNLINFAAAMIVKDNTITKSYFQIKNKTQSEKWFEAYDKELNKLIKIGKMKLINKSDTKETEVIPIMELYSKKIDNISKEEIFKCRFVTRGDMQDEFLKYYSPTEKWNLSDYLYSCIKNWKWIQLDIGNAFLNATLDRLYYYVLPQKLRRIYSNYVWGSKQALYGLKESPLYWCKEISSTVKNLDFEVNVKESTIFVHRTRRIIILLYVDDILFASDEENQLNWILKKLKEVYDIKNTAEVKNYVGFEIFENEQFVFLTAENYIVKLAETFEVKEDERNVIPHAVNYYINKPDDSRKLEAKIKYQSNVGSLPYIARVFRPDIAFQTNMLAQFASKPTTKHLNAAKKVVNYLLNTKKYG